MRMKINYKYKKYPLSEKLTDKSERVGLLTSPFYAIFIGVIVGFIAYLISDRLSHGSSDIQFTLFYVCIIVVPILLFIYRKKKFAQYDAEYEQLLRSMKSEQPRQE